MEEPMIEVTPDTLEEPGGDKTPKNEFNLDDMPDDEEEPIEEKSSKEKPDRSEVAQKIKYREKAKDWQRKYEDLEAKMRESDTRVERKGELDDKEKAARAFIRNEARQVLEEVRKAEKEEQAQKEREFKDTIDEIVEDNPEVTEQEILDIIEEFEVTPETALKILLREKKDKPKPRMPKPKQQGSDKKEDKPDDKGKDMWQIAKEVKEKLKSMAG